MDDHFTCSEEAKVAGCGNLIGDESIKKRDRILEGD